jgi:hypothetical protein
MYRAVSHLDRTKGRSSICTQYIQVADMPEEMVGKQSSFFEIPKNKSLSGAFSCFAVLPFDFFLSAKARWGTSPIYLSF